jgi:predicted RNA binding protein YcfA (HicA-like mRNA interferase family)
VGNFPVLSGNDIVRVFETFGWSVARRRGSHIVMVMEGQIATLSIPEHKEVAKGTLRSLIRSANLSVDEFAATMKEVL